MTTKKIAYLKGPFSLTGELRLQFIDLELAQYLVKNRVPLSLTQQNLTLTPIACRMVPKGIAFKFEQITNRTDAEALPKGDVLAAIEALPELNEDYYGLDDLVGLSLTMQGQDHFAVVKQAYNFGASDIVECELLTDILQFKKGLIFTLPMIDDIIEQIDFDTHILNVSDKIIHYVEACEA